MRSFKISAVVVAIASVGGFLLWPRGGIYHLTPLERELGFRGAVRKIVQIDTQEDVKWSIGTQADREATTISRDGRSATSDWKQKYTDRKGMVSYSGSVTTYKVTGTAGNETLVRQTQYHREGQSDDSIQTVTTYQDFCPVKSVSQFKGRGGNYTSINEQTCDKQGRTLTDVNLTEGQVKTRSTNWWLPGGLGVGNVWNAGFENRPATTHWVLLIRDWRGQGRIFSPLVNVTTKQGFDSRGNWIWRKDEMSPVPLSGNNVAIREMTYWDTK